MNDTTQPLVATSGNFATAVIARSEHLPVLVDFWAPWCGPCRTLMPLLDRIAEGYAGRMLLAKLNVDEEPELAARFGVRSIPTVVLLHRGRVVDQFIGVQPETQIRAMLDRHVATTPSAGADEPIQQAHALARDGDTAGALRLIDEKLTERPDDPALLAVLAGLQILSRDASSAAVTIEQLTARDPGSPALAALRTRLGFLESVAAWPDAASARARLAAEPGDSAARHALAAHEALAGDYTAALDEWLELLRRDRSHADDVARRSMLAVFDLLGNDERVASYRRRMAALLH